MLWRAVQMFKNNQTYSKKIVITGWSLFSTGIFIKTMDWIHIKNTKKL
jgi:hypothetical protein